MTAIVDQMSQIVQAGAQIINRLVSSPIGTDAPHLIRHDLVQFAAMCLEHRVQLRILLFQLVGNLSAPFRKCLSNICLIQIESLRQRRSAVFQMLEQIVLTDLI